MAGHTRTAAPTHASAVIAPLRLWFVGSAVVDDTLDMSACNAV
jgi:hypothetical protein